MRSPNAFDKTKYIWPIKIPILILGALIMLTLIIQLLLALDSYRRILPVSEHMAHMENLQLALTTMDETLAFLMPDKKQLDRSTRANLQSALQAVLKNNNHLASSTPDQIRSAQKLLDDEVSNPRILLLNVLKILRQVFREEASAHKKLTVLISEDAKFEAQISLIKLIIIPFIAMFLLYLMKDRILQPLRQMGLMMELLGNRQYQKVTLDKVDPSFKDILENYNDMVVRLSDLEKEHLLYQQSLEQQVEKVVGTLIEQQRNIANTERLAALGELTARFVHEIRNPLAGIKMACVNLKNKLNSGVVAAELTARIDLVVKEINRIIDTLNQFLQQAHQEPEPLVPIRIDQAVNELLSLVRFQIPKNILLDYQGDSELICMLPDNQLRQALLNLIINAQQALGELGGRISIRIACKNNKLTITVTDDGPGFSEAFLETGIRSFTTRRKEGTGLGLSMVQRFVRNHEGEITVNNIEPNGACISIRLNCIEPKYD